MKTLVVMIVLLAIRILAALLLVSSASAAEFPVTDQDQAVIQEICETAARSPSIPIEMTSGLAQWCIQWKQRVRMANAPKPAETKPAETKPE